MTRTDILRVNGSDAVCGDAPDTPIIPLPIFQGVQSAVVVVQYTVGKANWAQSETLQSCEAQSSLHIQPTVPIVQ